MASHGHHLGCKNSGRTVKSWEGLVKLSHMAANGWGFVDQVNLKTRSGKIKRGLNTADPSTDNHYVSKMTLCETFAKLFNLFFFHFYPLIENQTLNPKL